MQRFQVTVWPDPPATWRNVDRYPNPEARAGAHAALERLKDLTPQAVDAETDPLDPTGVPFLRFDPEGQSAFDAWRTDFEPRLCAGDLHPAMESHLAKYRSLIPSLALILHLVDGGAGPVPLAAIERAIR
jgi:putative DNA primase/helicase